ncbi:ABC transporter ATP-binding protein [Paenibacillus dendritiformis]|uniref:ABC transporter-like protein n=1 Tax=Paenibacillus dendritiformis C454 TaxID=1131935 RepID=H3SLZ3_9BACL|nr:ABC transporter ATP-binding protein [Paenibacillus dendritiformis]EHQ59909.1 ABC transporter-like protein [Paenibacillus dendritiformis C454]PZM66683.1 ABC transporter ATP-binding protein [Paenibacillus dendritiformis]CAH8768665.1 ABC transporter ATP-binding protein/permease [Paenibacillus dendritiformis]
MKNLKLLFIVLGQVYRVSPMIFAGIAGIHLLQASLPVLQIYFTAQVVNMVTAVLTGDALVAEAYIWLSLQMVVLIAGMLLASLRTFMEQRMNAYVSFWFQHRVAEKLNELPFIFFEQPESYDKLQRALRNLDFCGVKIVFYIFSIIQSFITLTGLLILLANFHYTLPLVMLLFILPLLVVQKKEGSSRFIVVHMQTASSRMGYYLNELLRSKESAKEVRLFNAKDFLVQRWRDIYFRNTEEKLQVERKNAINRFSAESIVTISSFAILAVFIWFGTRLKLTIGSYVALYQAIQDTRSSIQSISYNLGQIYQDSLFIKELFNFMEIPVSTRNPDLLPFRTPLSKGIEVRHVSFRYPNQQKDMLRNISFTIKPGEKIAIVGENGAGKSTLAKIMLGLYQPTEGEVRYDNRLIDEYDPASFHERITAVFQDFFQYEFTLRDNIVLHRPAEDRMDDSKLREAIKKAELDSLVETLTEGVDSQLGIRFSGGRELSQGQWQKVAIARAFYRDFDMIFLDEPTAAVDPLTESAIFENLMELTKGKTAVFISHRLGSCRHADRILVLHEGTICEEGSHEDLIATGGVYANMFEKQAKWYREGCLQAGAG